MLGQYFDMKPNYQDQIAEGSPTVTLRVVGDPPTGEGDSRGVLATYAFSGSVAQSVRQGISAGAPFSDDVREAFLSGQHGYVSLLPAGVNLDDWDPQAGEAQQVSWLVVSSEGAIRFAPRFPDPFLAALTVEELRNLVDAGFAIGNPERVLVTIPWGTGGGDGTVDIVNWLLDQGVDLSWQLPRDALITWLSAGLFRGVRGGLRDRRARRVAVLWAEQSGIRYPRQLRAFTDLRREWSLDEVARRLTIPKPLAKSLLKALGHVEDARSNWVIGTSKGSLALRRTWVHNEDRTEF